MQDGNTAVQTAPVQQQTFGERFTSMVIKEFSAINQGVELTSFQKRLCQSYFVKLDQTLKDADKKRMAKAEKNRDIVAVTWENVNVPKLAMDVVAYSSIGLDPMQPNHLNLIPYKNNATGKYDIGFIIGYRGCELKATKYGLDIPDEVVVEVVYKNDKFKQIKKDMNNRIESYVFEIVDDFNRGDIVGGFYYFSYKDNPEKNRVEAWNMADINKRKPAYASVEFWGGEKDKWENGQKVGKEVVEGWLDEMVYKTMFRAAYNSITIDSQKIDEAYHSILKIESDLKQENVRKEILDNANKSEIGFDEAEIVTNKELNAAPLTQPILNEQPQPVAQTHANEATNGTLFNKTGPNF